MFMVGVIDRVLESTNTRLPSTNTLKLASIELPAFKVNEVFGRASMTFLFEAHCTSNGLELE